MNQMIDGIARRVAGPQALSVHVPYLSRNLRLPGSMVLTRAPIGSADGLL